MTSLGSQEENSRIEYKDKEKGDTSATLQSSILEDVESKKQKYSPNPNAIETTQPFQDSKNDPQQQQSLPSSAESIGNQLQLQDRRKLHPFVHWAQTPTHISLRVDLSQVENIDTIISEEGTSLQFSAQGKGAHGLQNYYFFLDFFSQVNKKFECHPIGQYVLILIKKEYQQTNWPRLTKQSLKLPWLRIDFDRYEGESSDENFEDNSEDNYADDDVENDKSAIGRKNKEKSLNELYQKQTGDPKVISNSWSKSLDNIFKNNTKNFDIFNPFNKRTSYKSKSSNMKQDHRKEATTASKGKNTAKHSLSFRNTYLFLYNLCMFVIFLKVVMVLCIKVLTNTIDDDYVQGAAFIIKMLTFAQLLETVHPMLGLVPGGPLMPFTQVVGRLLVNYFLSESSIRIDAAPYAHYLFLVWSSIEIFRYSFYALRVFRIEVYALTWCRYTLFLPLYPMGGLCESMVLFATIRYYERTRQFSLDLPNSANISLSLPIMLRIYIFVFLGPTIYSLMKYMWKQRCKQLKEKVD